MEYISSFSYICPDFIDRMYYFNVDYILNAFLIACLIVFCCSYCVLLYSYVTEIFLIHFLIDPADVAVVPSYILLAFMTI